MNCPWLCLSQSIVKHSHMHIDYLTECNGMHRIARSWCYRRCVDKRRDECQFSLDSEDRRPKGSQEETSKVFQK